LGGRASIVKRVRVNRQIRAREIRLIGEEGKQLGIIPLYQAFQLAAEHGLDLVEVSPTAKPPVCRILDYGKYKYEQAKKERQLKRGQKVGLLRELRLSPTIDEHDLQAKIKTAKKLLEEGNKLRLVLRFRGRSIIYPELGVKVMQKVVEALKEVAIVNENLAREQRIMALTLSPISTVKKTKEVKLDAKAQDS
jgi:translation initiation factor IF-3